MNYINWAIIIIFILRFWKRMTWRYSRLDIRWQGIDKRKWRLGRFRGNWLLTFFPLWALLVWVLAEPKATLLSILYLLLLLVY